MRKLGKIIANSVLLCLLAFISFIVFLMFMSTKLLKADLYSSLEDDFDNDFYDKLEKELSDY